MPYKTNIEKLRQCIPSELLEKIQKDNNWDATDDKEFSALHYAIWHQNLEAIKILVEFFNVKCFKDKNNRSPLHFALTYARKEDILQYLLDKWKNQPEYYLTDYQEKNVLHYAAEAGYASIFQALIQDEKHAKKLENRDMNGKIPYNYAVIKKHIPIIKILHPDLSESQIQKLPEFGMSARDINQANTNAALKKYLTLLGRRSEDIIDKNGNCNGWSFLFQIYLTSGREEEFNYILKVLAKLNADTKFNEVLDAPLEDAKDNPIPASMKGKYKSHKELLEQITNELALFQFSTQGAKALQLSGWKQYSRIAQYEFARDLKEGREIASIFEFKSLQVDIDQLTELLQYAARWPGISVDIGGAKHSTSIFVMPDGKLKYFDPNFSEGPIIFDTADDLAKHIMHYMFKEFRPGGKILLDDFDAYQFYGGPLKIPKIEKPREASIPYPSRNGFTELHLAVMENDLKKVNAIINENIKINPTQDPKESTRKLLVAKDVHNATAFSMAVRMQNIEIMKLLNNAVGNISDIAAHLDFEEVAKLNPMFIEKLFAEKWLTIEDKDQKGRSIFHSPLGYTINGINAIKNINPNATDSANRTVFMCALEYRADIDVIRKLLTLKELDLSKVSKIGYSALNYAIDAYAPDEIIQSILVRMKAESNNIDSQDYENKTPLMSAIKANNVAAVKLLLDAGAQVDLEDKSGKTAIDYAEKVPEILKLIVEARPYSLYFPKIVQGINGNKDLSLLKPLFAKARVQELQQTDKSGNTLLILGLKNGFIIDFVKELLNKMEKEKMEFINQKNQAGETALMIAVEKENIENVRFLLEAGANVNTQDINGKTALMWAAESQNSSLVELLLQYGADISLQDSSNKTVIDHEKEAADDFEDEENEGPSILEILTEWGPGQLCEAIEKGKPIDLIKPLIEKAGDLNKIYRGARPLMLAIVKKTDTKVTELILNRMSLEGINQKDEEGISALMVAIIMNRTAEFKLLLQKGAKVDDQDKNNKSVMDYLKDKPEMLKILEEFQQEKAKERKMKEELQPRISAQDSAAFKKLLLAIKHHEKININTIKDINQKDDKFGKTALMWAILYKNLDSIEALIKAGARTEDDIVDKKKKSTRQNATDYFPSVVDVLDSLPNINMALEKIAEIRKMEVKEIQEGRSKPLIVSSHKSSSAKPTIPPGSKPPKRPSK